MNNTISKELKIILIPVGIGLNLGIGALVHLLKLPVYLDAVGTIIITLLLGWKIGVATGVMSFLIGGLIVNPVMPYFIFTQAAISIYTYLIAKAGGYKNIFLQIISGIGLGIVAAIVSAPVIVYFFGGVTGSGASFVVAYLLATGDTLLKSVVLGGISVEPIDKTLQTLLAIYLIKGMPENIIDKFKNNILVKSKLVSEE